MSPKSSALAAKAAPSHKTPAERVVRDIRRATRKQHSAEDKIRIVLDGLRGEDSIAVLCRREGIAESLYYSWSKEFLEAGGRHGAGGGDRRGQGAGPGSPCAQGGHGRAGARAAAFEKSMTGAGDDRE